MAYPVRPRQLRSAAAAAVGSTGPMQAAEASKVSEEEEALFPLTSATCSECLVTTRWLGFHRQVHLALSIHSIRSWRDRGCMVSRVWHGSGEIFDTVDLHLPDAQFGSQACFVRCVR